MIGRKKSVHRGRRDHFALADPNKKFTLTLLALSLLVRTTIIFDDLKTYWHRKSARHTFIGCVKAACRLRARCILSRLAI